MRLCVWKHNTPSAWPIILLSRYLYRVFGRENQVFHHTRSFQLCWIFCDWYYSKVRDFFWLVSNLNHWKYFRVISFVKGVRDGHARIHECIHPIQIECFCCCCCCGKDTWTVIDKLVDKHPQFDLTPHLHKPNGFLARKILQKIQTSQMISL